MLHEDSQGNICLWQSTFQTWPGVISGHTELTGPPHPVGSLFPLAVGSGTKGTSSLKETHYPVDHYLHMKQITNTP